MVKCILVWKVCIVLVVFVVMLFFGVCGGFM